MFLSNDVIFDILFYEIECASISKIKRGYYISKYVISCKDKKCSYVELYRKSLFVSFSFYNMASRSTQKIFFSTIPLNSFLNISLFRDFIGGYTIDVFKESGEHLLTFNDRDAIPSIPFETKAYHTYAAGEIKKYLQKKYAITEKVRCTFKYTCDLSKEDGCIVSIWIDCDNDLHPLGI